MGEHAIYAEHYGLSGRPFQLTPDPRFWFESATHKKAMAYLGYGLAQAEGFIVVTGEIGSGKTTLVGHLMETIDPSRIEALPIATSNLNAVELLRRIAAALGAEMPTEDKGTLVSRIEALFLERGRSAKRTLLVIDEAQNLPVDALEELRLLSNIQSGGRAVVQIFLLGQPEFRDSLNAPQLEQLRQRVIATHHLTPMSADEVGPYLAHRLRHVGWKGEPLFTDAAAEAIYRHSGGVPRIVNRLAARAMLLGAIDKTTSIDAPMVDAIAAELASEEPSPDLEVPAPGFSADPAALDVAARMAMLEAQVSEQDAALRRVLGLLVQWVEADDQRASGDERRQAPAA